MKISYKFKTGCKLQKEYGKTPNGIKLNGRWVLRDKDNIFIDFDMYVNALAERNNLELINLLTINPTKEQIDSVCLSYTHDFRLLSIKEQEILRFKAIEWLRAWQKEFDN
nr:MAG: hypothetical protein B6I27_02635 [Erwiniaceae bacterium 4572_131]